MAVKTAQATLRETQHFPVCRVWGYGSVGGAPLPEKQILSSMSHFLLCSWLAACSHLSPPCSQVEFLESFRLPSGASALGLCLLRDHSCASLTKFPGSLEHFTNTPVSKLFFPNCIPTYLSSPQYRVGSGEWAALTLTHFEILSP